MFNDTYRNVKNNARMIWATERYKFLIEGQAKNYALTNNKTTFSEYHYLPMGPIFGGFLQVLLCIWFLICLTLRFLLWIPRIISAQTKDFERKRIYEAIKMDQSIFIIFFKTDPEF